MTGHHGGVDDKCRCRYMDGLFIVIKIIIRLSLTYGLVRARSVCHGLPSTGFDPTLADPGLKATYMNEQATSSMASFSQQIDFVLQ